MLQSPMNIQPSQTQWSSSSTFILAAVGAAVGLGNMWRFPYVVGQNGGGAFIVIYLIAVFGIVTPILIGEILVGRRGQMTPPRSVAKVAAEANASSQWQGIGWMGILAAVLILSFYSVIAGWLIAYIPKTFSGKLIDLSGPEIGREFGYFLASPLKLMFWHSIFMIATIVVVIGGLRHGIEWAAKYLMPMLFVLLIALVIFAAIVGDLGAAANFLLKPDFSQITYHVVVTAFGQAFFSVGVGGCLLMNYGAYLPKHVSIPRSAFMIAGIDTLVAILAGFAIFPIIFAYGLDPTEGPGLIFVTLPVAFGSIPYGSLIGTAFFVLLLIAAFTSSIAILDPIARLAEEKGSLGRTKVAIFGGFLAWLIGILTVLSFNIWSDIAPLGFIPGLQNSNFFELIDGFVTKILMPMGGILLAIFVGWQLPKRLLLDELGAHSGTVFFIWKAFLRYIVPAAIIALFLSGFLGS